jgi:AraC family transcriptional regulator
LLASLEPTRTFAPPPAAAFAGVVAYGGSHPTAQHATIEHSEELTVSPLEGDVAASVVRILESVRRNFDNREAALASLDHAASLLQIEIDRRAAPRNANLRGALVGWQMNRVMAYIDANLDGPIRTGDLAAITRRSSDYFGRAFKCTTGETPHDFIVARRLRRARELMLESDASLAEIAISCGFADQAHFSKVFRLGHDLSPAAWRRERREIGEQRMGGSGSAPVAACA